jgi:hypothetical protein
MCKCSAGELVGILSLGVAFNAMSKRHLIWDSHHVNENLVDVPLSMVTLQWEGQTLFEPCSWGGGYQHI